MANSFSFNKKIYYEKTIDNISYRTRHYWNSNFLFTKNNNHTQTQPASISSESNKTINGEIDESNKIKDFSLPDITGKEVSVMNEISKTA